MAVNSPSPDGPSRPAGDQQRIGHAEAPHRTACAAWAPRGAPGGAEVHQRLVEIVATAARHEPRRQIPQGLLAAKPAETPGPEEHASEDAADVRIEDGDVMAVR